MAFHKYSFVYLVCAVALIYYHTDFVSATKCFSCDSKAAKEKPNYCNNTAINASTTNIPTCDGNICGEYTYQKDNVTYTIRGCDLNCTTVQDTSKNISAFECHTCDSDNCNSDQLNSATSAAISFLALLVSAIMALCSF